MERLVVPADNVLAGYRAELHARKIYGARGFSVAALWPWYGLNDWNDVLRKKREGGGRMIAMSGLVVRSIAKSEDLK